MGGARGTPVGFTPQTSGLVQRGGGGISNYQLLLLHLQLYLQLHLHLYLLHQCRA